MSGSVTPDSVSFNRAADYYDDTRRREPATMSRIVDLLVENLAGRGQCLEVGVGTGRLALPLATAGIEMAGVDISEQMLSKLIENAGGRPPFQLAVADARALPFPDGWFGATLISHVLQLVADWQQVVTELVRVVGTGGVVIVDLGWRRGLRLELQQRFADEVGLERIDIGLDPKRVADLDREFARHGAVLRELPRVVETRDARVGDLVDRLEAGVVPVTWSVDEVTRRKAAAAVRTWARQRYGSLDRPRAIETIIAMRAYDVR